MGCRAEDAHLPYNEKKCLLGSPSPEAIAPCAPLPGSWVSSGNRARDLALPVDRYAAYVIDDRDDGTCSTVNLSALLVFAGCFAAAAFLAAARGGERADGAVKALLVAAFAASAILHALAGFCYHVVRDGLLHMAGSCWVVIPPDLVAATGLAWMEDRCARMAIPLDVG